MSDILDELRTMLQEHDADEVPEYETLREVKSIVGRGRSWAEGADVDLLEEHYESGRTSGYRNGYGQATKDAGDIALAARGYAIDAPEALDRGYRNGYGQARADLHLHLSEAIGKAQAALERFSDWRTGGEESIAARHQLEARLLGLRHARALLKAGGPARPTT